MNGIIKRLKSSIFYTDEILSFVALLLLMGWGAIVFLILWGIRGFDFPLIIHFHDGRSDLFGTKKEIVSVAIIGFMLVVMNMLLTGFLYYRERFLARLTAVTSVFLTGLILIAIGVIIAVNQ